MNKQAWIFAAVFSSLLAFAWMGFEIRQRNRAAQALARELEALRVDAQSAAEAASGLASKLAEAQERLQRLEAEKASIEREQHGLQERMKAALESRDVAITELEGRLTVNILDRILFDSGEAALKPEGEEVLQRIATVLAQFPRRRVYVVGHTDNVPIRPNPWSRYPTNWELSAARATAAVRFLHERAGVDPHRLGALGHGEFQPVADNATPEGRAQNRRIAVVILPEEFNVSDTAAPAPVAPVSNAAE